MDILFKIEVTVSIILASIGYVCFMVLIVLDNKNKKVAIKTGFICFNVSLGFAIVVVILKIIKVI